MIPPDTADQPAHGGEAATTATPHGHTAAAIIPPRRAADNAPSTAPRRHNPLLGQPLRLAVQRPGIGIVVVRLTGELDLAAMPRLTELVRQRLTAAVLRALVLDLSQVSFVASCGAELLLYAQRRADQRGIGMYVIIGQGSLRRLLNLTGLTERFQDRDTVAEAVAEARQ